MKFRNVVRAKMRFAFVASLLGLCVASCHGVYAEESEKEMLTIGSAAPDIDIEHWLSNGNGTFKPIKKFDSGKVYVVEFWATWCGPCIASMPHLSELQKSYADKSVQFISVSDEDVDTVKQFLETPSGQTKESNGASAESKPQTFGELTSVYCLTSDPDSSVSVDYMTAAGLSGIPSAFIIGKDGKIDWIGHPMAMDEPLEKVVAGTWDREAFGAEYRKKQEAEMQMNKLMQLAQQGDNEGALKLLDSLLDGEKDPAQLQQLQMYRVQLLGQIDPARALEEIDKLIAQSADKDPTQQFQIKMMKVETLMQTDDESKLVAAFQDAVVLIKDQQNLVLQVCLGLGRMADAEQIKSQGLLVAAGKEMETAAAGLEQEYKAMGLDAAARLYAGGGDYPKAIELVKQAISMSDELSRADLEEHLKSIEAKAAAKK